jgi:hypothetical protein
MLRPAAADKKMKIKLFKKVVKHPLRVIKKLLGHLIVFSVFIACFYDTLPVYLEYVGLGIGQSIGEWVVIIN